MARACIITYDEYINIPYVKDYEKLLRNNGIEYDFIFWNRSGGHIIAYNGDAKAHTFNWQTKKSKLSKLLPFLLWSGFARKVLRKYDYDFLIVCTTIPAILLADVLLKKYKKKFLLDIRDFTYENISIYKALEKKLIAIAGMIIISSKGFLTWLPEDADYVYTHNLTL